MVASWTPKRWDKAHAITSIARELAATRGFDEFSLDELADAAGVSRRTLFNYFPGKADAVLGLPPQPLHELLQTFAAGGPSGDLLEDAIVVIRQIITDKAMCKSDWLFLGNALERSPKLLAAVGERFRAMGEDLFGLIAAREGAGVDQARAAAMLGVIAALIEASIKAFVRHPGQASLRELFDAHVAATRVLFADHLAWRAERAEQDQRTERDELAT